MLSDTEILDAVRSGQVRIAYTFLPNDAGEPIQQGKTMRVQQDERATNFFEDHLTRSRIGLTLGALVKPVSRSVRIRKANRFQTHSSVADLRSCPKGFPLGPSQSAVVFSNEHIVLPPDIAGLIVGRVSSYNNGLVTATSFLDSGWNGLVKIHLINTSGAPVNLTLGMELGRLFLFRTTGASADTSSVSGQGVHFGLTWPRILDDSIDPFPTSAHPNSGRWSGLVEGSNELLQKYAGLGLAALVFAVGIGAWRVLGNTADALEVADRVDQIEATVGNIEATQALGGLVSVSIPGGSDTGRDSVTLPGTTYRGAESHVWIDSGSLDLAGVVADVRVADETVVIDFRVHADGVQEGDRKVDVNWVYVP